MNKRQRLKKKKKEYVAFAYKIDIASEMKEDSIAHLVKSYFTMGNIHNNEMFYYNKETQKILVSKKALNHLLRLCDSELLEHNFDFELVPEINVLYKNEKLEKEGINNGKKRR